MAAQTRMSAQRDRSARTRLRRLKKSPLCVDCLLLGKTKATEEIDHIIPLEWAGREVNDAILKLLLETGLIKAGEAPKYLDMNLDVDINTQGLCVEHNRHKRNRQSYGHKIYGVDGWPKE